MRKHYVAILVLFLVSPAFGWNVKAHLQMTRDAVSLMPEEFRKTFTEHKKFVESGIKDPDILLKDWQNHYYVPSIPEGTALDRIDKLIGIVRKKFERSTPADTAKQLCYLAHYIGDLWSPEPICKGAPPDDSNIINNYNMTVLYEGYRQPIEDFHEYFEKRANWRWRIEASNDMIPLLYSEAVNDIARTWLTLWQQSGHTVEPQKVAVIEHKKGALSINFERLLIEEGAEWSQWDVEGTWYDKYQSHTQEMDRLASTVLPSDEALAVQAQQRTEETKLNRLSPAAPFEMLEVSLKAIGDKSYLIGRIRNKGKADKPVLSLMYPGIKGPIAQVRDFKPGQVVKFEAILPVDASKDKIQLIYPSD
jgi:hypothetical protein